MEISVVIPTYMRPHRLRLALTSVQEQNVSKCEILVVDNAASGEIEQLVTTYQPRCQFPLKYVPEPKLGLHHARHAGARAAIGELLVFTDDDATFDRDWLLSYVKAFATNPHMLAAGGPVRPVWEASPPRWMENFLRNQKIFPILSLMEQSKEFSLSGRGFFFGVNMAIRRTALFELGGFNPEAFGDDWLGNGETGLNYKLWERGLLVGYVPEAVVYHHIPTERMSLAYFRRRMANEGACDMYTRFHHKMPGQLGLLWHAASIMLRNSAMWLIEPMVIGRTDWLSLRVQLQAARSRAQLQYISRLMRDKDFREFVLKEDWLNSPCILR
jgi:GT2 family glycosyltransferase